SSNSYCNSMNWMGLSDTVVLIGGGGIQVFGSLNVHPKFLWQCGITFRASGNATIQAAGVTFMSGATFNGTGSWHLLSALNLIDDVTTAGPISYLRRGSLYTNGYPMVMGSFFIFDTLSPLQLDLD